MLHFRNEFLFIEIELMNNHVIKRSQLLQNKEKQFIFETDSTIQLRSTFCVCSNQMRRKIENKYGCCMKSKSLKSFKMIRTNNLVD